MSKAADAQKSATDMQAEQVEETAAHQPVNPEHAEVKLAHDADEGVPKISFKTYMAIIALVFNYLGNVTMLATGLPIINYINQDLGPVSTYTWIASANSVAAGIGALIGGSLSDFLGRRWFIIGGSICGILGCIVGASANTVNQVIAGQAILGFSGGASFMTFACIAELVSRRQRGPTLAAVNLFASIWTVAGSLIGHAMVLSAGGWRSVFYQSLAIDVFATLLAWRFYHPAPPLSEQIFTRREILRNFDYPGLLAMTAGPVLLLVSVVWLGGTYTFDMPQVAATFSIGIALIIALVFWETYGAKNPLLHPFVFKRVRTFTLLLVITFTSGMLYYALLAFLPTYLSVGYLGDDPIMIGVYQLPVGVGAAVGGISIGIAFAYVGHTRLFLVFGVVIQTLFIGLMAVPNTDQVSMALAFSFFAGVGIGLEQVISILLAQLATPEEWIGFATGALAAFRLIGGSVGTAIYITIFSKRSASIVPRQVTEAVINAGLPVDSVPEFLGSITGATQTPLSEIAGVSEDIIRVGSTALKNSYLHAFQMVWYVAVALGVVTLACAVCTKDLSHTVNNSVAQKLQNVEIETQFREKEVDVIDEKVV